MNKKIVAGAIIVENGRIFIACRPEGKTLAHHWEFPGGKQEPGETLPDCLRRELKEELNINAVIGEPFMVSTFEYDFAVIELHTFLLPWKSRKTSNPTNMRKPPGFSLAN